MKGAARPEFSRLVGLDELADGEIRRTEEADAGECRALASRFDLIAVDALVADVRLRRVKGGPLVRVEGRLAADVHQRCVLSLKPVPAHIEAKILEIFGPQDYRSPEGEEGAEPPEIFDEGGIDLGELAAQTLSLSLDPYPRAPGADAGRDVPDREDGGDRRRPLAALGEMMQKQRK